MCGSPSGEQNEEPASHRLIYHHLLSRRLRGRTNRTNPLHLFCLSISCCFLSSVLFILWTTFLSLSASNLLFCIHFHFCFLFFVVFCLCLSHLSHLHFIFCLLLMLSFTYYVLFYCSCSIYCFSFHFHVNILCSIHCYFVLLHLFIQYALLCLYCFGTFHFNFAISIFYFPFFLPSHPCDLGCFSFFLFLPQFLFILVTDVLFCLYFFACLPTRSNLLSFNSLFHLPLFVNGSENLWNVW